MERLLLMLVFITIVCQLDGKLVDLTHVFDSNTIYYPVYFPFNLTIVSRGWAKLGDGSLIWSEYNTMITPEHMGTHIDAPSHLADKPGYWRVHEIPIERFIGDAVVIDITYKADLLTNPDAYVTVADLKRWEEKYGRIKDGSIVFSYSGWDKYFTDEVKYLGNDVKNTSDYHWPGFGAKAAQWLLDEREISGIGSDVISFDVGKSNTFPVHIILLSANIYGLENVNNLGKIPEHGARVYVSPLKHRDGSGSPCRIIAEFDSDYVFNPMPDSSAVPLVGGSLLMCLFMSVTLSDLM